jgi:hypothetical protein
MIEILILNEESKIPSMLLKEIEALESKSKNNAIAAQKIHFNTSNETSDQLSKDQLDYLLLREIKKFEPSLKEEKQKIKIEYKPFDTSALC